MKRAMDYQYLSMIRLIILLKPVKDLLLDRGFNSERR